MEYTLTFAPTPDGIKLAKLFSSIGHIRAKFDRYIWAAPAHRSEFDYQDEGVQIVSYYDSTNVRITVWHDKIYSSWGAMIDATTQLGQRIVSIVEIGGPDEMMTVRPDNFYMTEMMNNVMHTQDQNDNHRFSMSSPAHVAEILDRMLRPWKNHSDKMTSETRPITPEVVRELFRQGFRSKDEFNWVVSEDNVGRIN